MTMFKIVETDNFGGDYPDEKFVNLPPMRERDAQHLADVINGIHSGTDRRRYWVVKPEGYTLQPGFEP